MTRISLVEKAQRAVSAVLSAGDKAIDATVGNGRDTLFLARATAPDGLVLGFDIQGDALATTRRRLDELAPNCRILLIQADHARMFDYIPAPEHGTIGAVMFNLGYRPGGCKSITTMKTSTLAALDASLAALRVGGILSVVAYTGHPGGREEANAAKDWARCVASKQALIDITVPASRQGNAPELILVTKKLEEL